MALNREQLEPYMCSKKRLRHKSHKWNKRQMNKWLRIKNKNIKEDDSDGHGKKVFYGWEY